MRKTIIACPAVAALLAASFPAQAAVGTRLERPAPTLAAPVGTAQLPEVSGPALFEHCTREGMHPGRYSQWSWCEWFGFFKQAG